VRKCDDYSSAQYSNERGRPWGSILASEGGLPGFLSRTSYSTLSVNAKSWPGNPISKHPISTDALIAGIGIEFGTRRRNKLAGVISQSTEVDIGNKLVFDVFVNEAIGYVLSALVLTGS